MRIAFAYGKYSLGGKSLDMSDPFGAPAGLTGSELSCLCFAREMGRRGHEITLYLPCKRPYDVLEALTWEGVRLRELSYLRQEAHDVVCAWNEPDILRDVHPRSLRLLNQQLNDFWYAAPGFDQFVDVYTSPSEVHLFHLRDQTPSPGKWTVLPNGCEPEAYPATKKVPGRVVYASSPDRGLHQLLPLWPEIRKRVPSAHLRIFYNLAPWFGLADLDENQVEPRHLESRRRAIAMRALLPSLLDQGVEVVGPVSHDQLTRDLCQAEVLAYPCDPYTWTEGFSVTTLEGCAAGCVPVISDADALGQIYGGACPTVRRPKVGQLDGAAYVDLLVRALTDEDWLDEVRSTTLPLAQQYTWPVLAKRLEDIIG